MEKQEFPIWVGEERKLSKEGQDPLYKLKAGTCQNKWGA